MARRQGDRYRLIVEPVQPHAFDIIHTWTDEGGVEFAAAEPLQQAHGVVFISSSVRSTSGQRRRNSRIAPATSGLKAAVPERPSESIPLWPRWARCAASFARAAPASMLRASIRKAPPAAVSSAPCGTR